jgi:hypothetical protein
VRLSISTGELVDSEPSSGILYLLEIDLEDRKLVKVGVTCRDKVEDRVCEILTSIWKRYRVFPRCYPKRYRLVSDVYAKEAELHRVLGEYRYVTEHVFSGSTEMFAIELGKAVEEYEKVVCK